MTNCLGGLMSKIVKHLPWIAPTVAILAVGSGFSGKLNLPFGGDDAEVQAAVDVQPVVEPVVAVAEPATSTASADDVAAQLAALLEASNAPEPVAAPVEVTRNQGFSVDTLQAATEVALGAEPAAEQAVEVAAAAAVTAPADAGPVNADFFAAAQANLARDRQCIDDLTSLASQARVYFPSGGLTAEQSGIEQARLLGLLAQQCPGVTIEVSGHSDPSGNPVVNQRLSLDRAEAVITRVAASGVDASLFQAVGRGDTVPSLVSGPQPQSYYDRRVEFAVVETPIQARFVAPANGSAGTNFQVAACVSQLEAAVQGASIEYAPSGLTVSDDDLAIAAQLARIATNCPEARLRLVGQHSAAPGANEDASTGRLRGVILMTRLVNQGFPSEQLILGAPSEATSVEGLSDSRLDFQVIQEDL